MFAGVFENTSDFVPLLLDWTGPGGTEVTGSWEWPQLRGHTDTRSAREEGDKRL